MTRKFLAVVGPTASGKTEWGLRLAKERGGEIISVDSRQVYRLLSVGTAKPQGVWKNSAYLVQGIPYHLVDMWEPDQAFTAANFVHYAEKAIAAIRERGKIPIFVGGTGLYFKALMEGLAPLPPGDAALRTQLRAVADTKGRPFLHAELAKVDPEAAARIPSNNIQRVLRALEVYQLTGKPISLWHRDHRLAREAAPSPYAIEMIGIALSRDALHRRIKERCTAMLENGMIEETDALVKKGLRPEAPALTGLGYPRVVAYLAGTLSRQAMAEALLRDTQQYAKRQMTWFRNQCEVQWKKL